ncbi:hypothetical protein [Pseudonocardia spinosispora]|uniref:hypothetical protein n=1 Tax=Pseudonocardia spinosispora TaxID=103441 RepID=UPI00042334AF|nr:hypothetical protein [Pseudonocardia spinosispora]
MTRRTEEIAGTPTVTASALTARLAAATALVGVTALSAWLLARATGSLPHLLPDYAQWQDQAYRTVPQFLRWCLGDLTEAQFYKSGIGALGLLAGAWLAHRGWRAGKRWAGFPICGGSGLWPWVLASASLGVLLSNLVWGASIPATGAWQPTFVPFVSVPPAIVLVYGAGTAVALTGAVLGALLTTPIALLIVNLVCYPLHLPAVIGSVTSMWIGALLAFGLCRHLPWMRRPAPAPAMAAPVHHGPVWVVRRVLADFTEAPFYGNELATLGLVAGTVLSYLLNPATPAYGSGLLPAMLTAQTLAATVAVLVYRRCWARHGWYPTFVPVVSVAPAAVLAYGATVPAIVLGPVLGALAGPPLAAAIARRLPASLPPFIGCVAAMTVCGLAILPLLGLL